MGTSDNFCVIIPAFREAKRIVAVIERALAHCPRVVVVDDGSPDQTAQAAETAGATVLRHTTNRGKGVALETGFAHGLKSGFDFVITLDADGQHDPDDIPAFLKAYHASPFQVIIGNRMVQAENMPFVRRHTNRVMSWMISREMQQAVPDTQCGFRLYAAEVLPLVLAKSAGFAAESEALLNLAKAGVKIGAVPIKVIYRDEHSKINPVVDTIRFFKMMGRCRKGDEGED